MSDNRSQNRPPMKPTPLDVMSTWIYGEPVAGATKAPTFRVKVLGNVPRFSVKTNVPEDKNNGVIDFNCDIGTFAAIMAKIKQLADNPEDQSTFAFEYQNDFVAGKKMDKMMTLATLKIGRDRETGKIYIAVLGYNRPKIQFFFGPSRFHALKRGDGSPISDAEISAAYAAGFVSAYHQLVINLLVSEFNPDGNNVAKAPVPQGGGGGGGNYQRKGGGAGSYGGNSNKSTSDSFDEFEEVEW